MPRLDLTWSDYADATVRKVESIRATAQGGVRYVGRDLATRTEHRLAADTLVVMITPARIRAGIVLAEGGRVGDGRAAGRQHGAA